MISAVIRWCLRNPFLVAIAVAGVVFGGIYAIRETPVDAIPDIGEKQVIVYADWDGRSPQDVDNQITYPLTTALTGTPGVKAIRSMSGFGFSMVFVIFTDDTDYYWARSRVIERMNVAQQRLPRGVVPVIGPDATALGQVFWYTVEGEGFDLAELRSVQDWYLRYQLNAVEGVSEVAGIGGFVKQYQIDIHPDKLRAHRVTLMELYEAVRKANIDVGAKVLEKNGVEFFIRGVGFIKSVEDLERVVIRQEGGTPIQVKNVATVTLGPDFRRGSLDKNGREAVGGVALMRYGENPLRVVERLKAKIEQLAPGLPKKTLADGSVSQVRIVPFYDRTEIVQETVATLKEALTEEALMASLVVVIFLLHLRSTLSVIITLPLSLCLCFILMYTFGVDSNIMSLAGLAIAIGDVGDMGIIMTENIYRHIAAGDAKKSHFQKIYEGAAEVGGAIVTAVSNTLVSFIPVFFLTDQEGKLFRPLAFTKTFAIGSSVILALTVVPLICYFLFKPVKWSRRTSWLLAAGFALISGVAVHGVFNWAAEGSNYSGWPMSIAAGVIAGLGFVRMTRERFLPHEANPVSRGIARVYEPALRWILAHKKTFMLAPLAILAAGLWIWRGIGREFMPPLDEGSFLYMPSLLPQTGLGPAIEVNAKQDLAIASVPEVESVVGKVGRAESALDPAPISMMESIVNLKPEDEWRNVRVERWFSGWPNALKAPLAFIAPEERRITKQEILAELQEKTALPGVLPTWLQPIQTRLVMLQTGFRAMMGVKIYGGDLKEIERIGLQIETLLKEVPGATDVVADRIVGKPYLEFEIDRDRIARYGVNIRDVQDVIEMAIGGMNLMETVEGRERYPVRLRYLREFREDIPELEKILLPSSTMAQVPLAQVVTIKSVLGPQEIKGERGLLTGYVTMNTRDRDEVSVVEDAERLLQAALKDGRLTLPAGYYWEWSGQFENQVRATERMQILVPVCIAIMFVSLYLGFRRKWLSLVIFADVAVSLSAGFLLLPLWGANLSVAVWVGFLVLLGVVDDDSVVLSTYLENIFDHQEPQSVAAIRDAVVQAGLKRIRANLMTICTTVFGLLPVFWATGRGSDVMKPIALPSLGGMAASVVTMFIVPCLFCAIEEWKWKRSPRSTAAPVPGFPE
jgi:Cu(I)/Ag(I) efflux system membrane protein CusA/SilA